MKENKTSSLFFVFSILLLIIWMGLFVNNYQKRINNLTGYWDMADKTSTIEKKSEYLDKYVNAIETLKLNEGHSVIVFKNYNNYMPNNYDAILSLQKRLYEIKKLNIGSLEYQMAIQQITQQEWSEATNLIEEFSLKYNNKHAFFTLGFGGSFVCISLLFFIAICWMCVKNSTEEVY